MPFENISLQSCSNNLQEEQHVHVTRVCQNTPITDAEHSHHNMFVCQYHTDYQYQAYNIEIYHV